MHACVCQADDYLLCESQLYDGLDSDQVCKVRGLLGKQTFEARQAVFRQGNAIDAGLNYARPALTGIDCFWLRLTGSRNQHPENFLTWLPASRGTSASGR